VSESGATGKARLVALLVSSNERAVARVRLREFDAEQFPGP
jgi:hypothetical protein